MTSLSWIRKLFKSHRPRTRRTAPPRRRPFLEALEDRLAPSAHVTITSYSIPKIVFLGNPVNLSAAATDLDNAPLTYTWTISSPGVASFTLSGANASFTPSAGGNYGVSLTVSGANGETATAPLPSNLMSWYPAQGNANDALGNYSGTPKGGVTFVPGKVGQAFSFDGATGSVVLPNNFLSLGNQPLSFETWFRTSTGGVILGQAGPSGYVPAVYVGTNGKLYAEMFSDGSINPIVSTGAVNDGQWHHVAVTFNGATETVYLDGVVLGTKAFTQTAYSPGGVHLQTGQRASRRLAGGALLGYVLLQRPGGRGGLLQPRPLGQRRL